MYHCPTFKPFSPENFSSHNICFHAFSICWSYKFLMQQNCNDIFMTKKKSYKFSRTYPQLKKPHWHHVYRNQWSVHKLYYYKITLKYTFDLISRCMWYGNLLANFFWFHDHKNLRLFSCNKYFLTVLHHALHLLTSDCSFPPLAPKPFLCNELQEFGVRSR